jgi:hypothetical protein
MSRLRSEKESYMRRHWNYLKYVLRHKWFVFVAGLKTGASLWRLLKHDWHKFLLNEWLPYARTFYKSDGSKQYVESAAFTYAWNLHQKRADHHWQHWLITWDRGETEALDMSGEAIAEMLADWYGAGKAITGKWEAHTWYEKNRDRIKLSEFSRNLVEAHLKSLATQFK